LLVHPPVVLEMRFEFPAGHQESDLAIRSAARFDKLLTALRLLKPGRVERTGVWERRERLGQLPWPNLLHGWLSERFVPWRGYRLETSNIQTLLDLFSFLENGVSNERLQNAVNRVSFAASRDRLVDQLLDLMIALEALFGDESGAIGYKVGM